MKQRQINTVKRLTRRLPGFVLVLFASVLLSACGNKLIRGASPIVYMTELSHQDNKIMLQLGMRNLNGVDLDVLSIDFKMSVEDDDLLVYQGPVERNIVANGTETWSVEVDEKPGTRALLESLEQGQVKSLPYVLRGSVISREDGDLRFEHEGHIYPLPGKPGYFR